MTQHDQPIANGIRTDHPIPGLPFVDDSHIPIEDPEAIEAIGRHPGTTIWGRYDADSRTGAWFAFTNDPQRHALEWVVRYHPEHGRTVAVYTGGGSASVHGDWFDERPVAVRSGGYWWDGTTWYRPQQVLSWASESYMRRPVAHPTTITAADMLDSSCKAELGEIRKVLNLELGTPATTEQWRHDFALWAKLHTECAEARPLERCVVALNAPELAEAALLGVEEFAQEAGIAASTLRAYLTRDEADLPLPQVVDGNRRRWSRPVVQDWVEQRRRDPSNLATVLSGDAEEQLAPGLRNLWKRLTESAFRELWGQPAFQRRWSRPHRNEKAVLSVAEHVGWVSALQLESVVPFDALAEAIEHAVLWELSTDSVVADRYVAFSRRTGEHLGWFVQHKPSRAPQLFGSIVREAERKLEISPKVTKASLRQALIMDGGFVNSEQLDEFFAVTLPPAQ
ncbi:MULTISPECIES: AlpA family transcriptional regulator [unclassified Crossiella]|uniref:helix-turn-helix transcriptional regulator n=1 Tax=unclassified Crossiella TaxID=2620835 RepID=UPI001FFF0A94|nr:MULTISPECIES: hypothetical protein [unclassified Crossiella]MCK2245449.1 hypothetical protein [Crossiella sp. S99.2]MCK2259101.1 hypothetical protein [Crossiella sp. S99.1]